MMWSCMTRENGLATEDDLRNEMLIMFDCDSVSLNGNYLYSVIRKTHY